MAVLGKNRGDRVDEEAFESEDDPSNLGRDKLRRSFLRNLAYLCDYEKGGDRTTAIALEQTPQGIVYWSASNKSPNSRSCGKDRTKTFLERVLSVLQNVTPGDTTRIESELFADSLAFSSSRIAMYIELLGREIDSVLQYLLNSDTDEGISLYTVMNIPDTNIRYDFHGLASRTERFHGVPCEHMSDVL
jgi:hypothetical protein